MHSPQADSASIVRIAADGVSYAQGVYRNRAMSTNRRIRCRACLGSGVRMTSPFRFGKCLVCSGTGRALDRSRASSRRSRKNSLTQKLPPK